MKVTENVTEREVMLEIAGELHDLYAADVAITPRFTAMDIHPDQAAPIIVTTPERPGYVVAAFVRPEGPLPFDHFDYHGGPFVLHLKYRHGRRGRWITRKVFRRLTFSSYQFSVEGVLLTFAANDPYREGDPWGTSTQTPSHLGWRIWSALEAFGRKIRPLRGWRAPKQERHRAL